MKTRQEHQRYKHIFLFWLPLEVTWLMMALEGSFLSAVIARLAEAKFNLAAFGVAFAITLFIEAPVLMLVSASNSLVRDWQAYTKMRHFSLGLITVVTGIMGLGLWPPFFYFITRELIGLPERVAQLTHQASLILMAVPWAIGYRRFYHGILIQHDSTWLVAAGTGIRLTAMALTGIVLFLFSPWPGACVGAWALTTGVVIEALASRLMAGKIIRWLRSGDQTSFSATRVLTYRDISAFYFPLALTSMLALGINPVISYFLAQGRMAIESLAVWPVLQALLLIFMSFGLSFQEVTIALLGDHLENYKLLRRFALGLLFLTVGLFSLFSFSSLSLLWFQRVSGLAPELAAFVQKPLQILAPLPALWMALTFQRSVLVKARRTAFITWATGLDILLMVIVLILSIHYWALIGVVAAALALVVGRLGSIAFLARPFSNTILQTRLPG
jgi:progressive ankylosis protein